MTFKFWLAQHADTIFYGLMVGLAIGEVVLRYVLKVKKDNVILEYVDSGFVAIILALIIRTVLVQTFIIPSGSMENTLLIGDQLMVNKIGYGITVPFHSGKILKFRDPKRGEIIVFRYPRNPSERYIKRCIGLPGDRVEMRDKVLYVNGQAQTEPYVIHRDERVLGPLLPRDNFGPIVVPAGNYLMLGDNRDQSADSRFWGFLPENLIEGKAWVVYWPLTRWRVIR